MGGDAAVNEGEHSRPSWRVIAAVEVAGAAVLAVTAYLLIEEPWAVPLGITASLLTPWERLLGPRGGEARAGVRRTLLEDDSLTVAEMRRRQRSAERMKLAVWLIPLALVGWGVPMVLDGTTDDLGLAAVSLGLVTYGAISSYLLGKRFSAQWESAITEKLSHDSRAASE